MERIRHFIIFLLLIIGSTALKRNKRVVNGYEADITNFPYHVEIRNADSSSHFCDGTIIDEFHVLSAAHCFDGFSPEDFKVVSGTSHLNNPKFVHDVSDLFVHERFHLNEPSKYDIAILRVRNPFQFSNVCAPAQIASSSEVYPVNSVVTITGFGKLTLHGYNSNVLQQGQTKIVDPSFCREKYSKFQNYSFTENLHICTLSEKGVGICKGDSGGPLSWRGKVIGIASYTMDGCSREDYPSVFTAISPYLDWIRSKIKRV